ncbi:hypothetical protein SUGI_0329590 [Cryptomeria japonica]|uniref:NAC domain-containing protein 76 n=1 Tax=Cryptomeria japonica TaxID=3369 RepID=UPI00240893E2|nr:NAC domain-containing protein 76 [Cryptomeria japonica]XP_057865255.1 NAC domain-containing protein 76 [Cryptomeria japonica]XP_059073009.1 NAC domain-containing protein 76 [Cryptomeria japonica]GLJ18540.1 hypothetical protein SUGI_0329590 [Cryptomeria japonica]
MGLSTNGQSSCVPPGFRFHPTDEELLYYYLKKKVSYEIIDLDVIRDVDLNKLEPWDLHERCKIGSAPQNEWYFFSHKDKKYPTGTRTNRATTAGFWKATGRDKAIYMNFKRIGMRKTLVFYTGRAPHGQKTEWIMHEYRLEDNENTQINEDGWVVCRVFKKRMHFKDKAEFQRPTAVDNEQNILSSRLDFPSEDHNHDQQLNTMPKQSQTQYNFHRDHHVFMQMPQLQSSEGSTYSASPWVIRQFVPERLLDNSSRQPIQMRELQAVESEIKLTGVNGFREERSNDWTVLDGLLNQQTEQGKHDVRIYNGAPQALEGSSHTSNTNNDYSGSEIDYWNYAR